MRILTQSELGEIKSSCYTSEESAVADYFTQLMSVRAPSVKYHWGLICFVS